MWSNSPYALLYRYSDGGRYDARGHISFASYAPHLLAHYFRDEYMSVIDERYIVMKDTHVSHQSWLPQFLKTKRGKN